MASVTRSIKRGFVKNPGYREMAIRKTNRVKGRFTIEGRDKLKKFREWVLHRAWKRKDRCSVR